MRVIGDLVAPDRPVDALAIRAESRAGSYSYASLGTTARRTGNLLRHYGVRAGATVAIDAGEDGDGGLPSVPAVVGFLGTALLGATARFDPGRAVDARALVAPADRIDEYDPTPGTRVLAYGDDPDDPTVASFEREVWSENDVDPPGRVSPDAHALAVGGEGFSHERLLDAAGRVADEAALDEATVVAPRAPLADPGTVVAGVLAPLSVGGAVLVPESGTGDVGVGRDVPEPRRIDPATVV